MKTTIPNLILPFILTSCVSFKDISKGNPVTEATLREKVKAGKTYRIKLNTGITLTVKVDSVDSMHIYATARSMKEDTPSTYPFTDTYMNLSNNTNKISVRKFNPLLTTGILVIPLATLSYAAIFSEEFWQNEWKNGTK